MGVGLKDGSYGNGVKAAEGFYWGNHGDRLPTAQDKFDPIVTGRSREQQLPYLAKGVNELKREEEAILEQSNRRNLGGNPMHDNQWGYGSFSSHARSYEHNPYDYS
ncbi:hypothetical protein M9H77_18115 [Catharanthus roseus]|uniref:Uncharacterized protein n=1 Tax=Catharanthus roseus TaxID=4058 RepID=A0ACC0B6K5_CATRO|nr:hypothetical protein M9H77_18115 [Catharanthus roseus]